MLEFFASEAIERAADRIVLAHELCDTVGLYAQESTDRQAEALNVMQITLAFCLQSLGMKETAAVGIFTETFRQVRRTKRKAKTLTELMTEMSLDQRK